MPNLTEATASMSQNSFFNNTSSNYSDSLSIEIATLQRRIILPVIPKEIISAKVLAAYDYLGYEYRTKDEVYVDTVGNFYMAMLLPLIKDGKSTEVQYSAPKTSNIMNKNSGLQTSNYSETNYINLVIPKYILLNFTKEVPKGTKFLVSFTGGLSSIGNMKIVGIAQIGTYRMKIDDPVSTLGMKQEDVNKLVKKDVEELNAEYDAAIAEEEREYGKSVE